MCEVTGGGGGRGGAGGERKEAFTFRRRPFFPFDTSAGRPISRVAFRLPHTCVITLTTLSVFTYTCFSVYIGIHTRARYAFC